MSNNDSETNKRHFSRILFNSTVSITSDERKWDTRLIDISLKGVLIEMPVDWDTQLKECSLELVLSDEIKIDMKVTPKHTENNHIGFQWTNIDLESISELRRLLELNLGDSELLNRELEELGNMAK